ncbi:MAG: hypothetical protein V2A77_10935 [Pseudomonadota bacterium]
MKHSALLATAVASLLSFVLVVPAENPRVPSAADSAYVVPAENPRVPSAADSAYVDFDHRLSQRRWLRKSLSRSEVRMHLGNPECVNSYGLLTFWRYPGQRAVIFDSSGYVIGWENF